MNKLAQFFFLGVLIIVAIKLFHFQDKLGNKIVDRARTGIQGRQADQLVIAAALTVGLGMVAVIASQAFKKVT